MKESELRKISLCKLIKRCKYYMPKKSSLGLVEIERLRDVDSGI